jgi:NADH-quinone oxidoreductase subunit A
MASPTAIVAYLALFAAAGFSFLFINLLVGWLVRPSDPHKEKLEVYECGEPTIGSSFVQFDLRFYVVALIFIVFDAEVAFLFPTATLFGKQTQLADPKLVIVHSEEGTPELTRDAVMLLRESGFAPPTVSGNAAADQEIRKSAQQFVWYTLAAIMVFFLILFVGFAYEWKTGAFDWVRAVTRERGRLSPAQPVGPLEHELTIHS